jgi:hypothetical protein
MANYDGHSVACKYKGHMMASMLEQSWARYFDDVGLAWRYVGDQLRWADFMVTFPGVGELPVEVKPYDSALDFALRGIERMVGKTALGLVLVGNPMGYVCVAVDLQSGHPVCREVSLVALRKGQGFQMPEHARLAGRADSHAV